MADVEGGLRGRIARVGVVVALWLGMLMWTHIPPIRGNILEMESSFFVWHWQLYSVAGHGICDVRYFDMNAEGAAIERWSLLGYEQPRDVPDEIARTEKQHLLREYARVCEGLREGGDTEPNVRVAARCGRMRSWQRVERRKRNVCELKEVRGTAKKLAKESR